MNVYEFTLDVDFGSGVLLIAAPDESTAKKMVSKINSTQKVYGSWRFINQFNGLSYDTDKPKVILDFSYVE